MSYILILFMSIGPLSDKDSMALTTVPFLFANEQICEIAGKKAVNTFDKGTKQGKYVCVKQTY